MEDGLKCVQDLKYLKKKEWDDLFASERKVDYLKGDPDDPKQCALELGLLKKHFKESKEMKEKPVSISKPGTIKAANDNTLLLDHLIGVLADVLCRRIWLIPLMITKSRRGTMVFYHFVCSPTKTAMI
jgi:hypothetical protein